MHNSAFRAAGLDCVYTAFDVHPDDIGKAADAVRALGISGVNVTIPHKETIIPFLDEVSPDAALTGAVNTVKNEDGRLTGYNTDVGGFLRAIEEELGIRPEGANVLLIGAGGAARAVLSALCMNGAAGVIIANRTCERAERLSGEFGAHFGHTRISAISMDDADRLRLELGQTDLLVNSTSAGMDGSPGTVIPLDALAKGAAVYDLVYKPRETALVNDARSLGHRASGGLGMLLYQGALSFEIWTGVPAPVDAMREALG